MLRPQLHKVLIKFSKLYFNLCSRKWLRIDQILKTIFQLVLSQIAQTKSKRNKFNFFRKMTVASRIWRQLYEFLDISHECRETLNSSVIKLISFKKSGRGKSF